MDLFSQFYWSRRFGSTQRFHGIRLLHKETVAHHSANVVLIIAHAFENPSSALLIAAAMHDLPEGITGDIPAPVKWAMKSEDQAFDFNVLEKQIFDFFQMKFPKLTPEEIKMLKAADFIDATLTCLLERRNGNREIDWPFNNYVLFESKSKLLDSYPYLKEVWEVIKFSYCDLQHHRMPTLLRRAEKVNFWEDR